MKKAAIIILGFAMLLSVQTLSQAQAATFMPVPTGKQVFNYPPTVSPVIGNSPSTSKPLGVGTIANGGDTVSLRLTLGQFAGPVDVYVGFYAPAIDNNIYLFTKTSIQTLAAGLVAWKEAITTANEALLGDIPTDELPDGKYTLYILVTPPDNESLYYLWVTDFNIRAARPPAFTMAQTLSDGAQRTTLAFSGLAMMTGNLEAQSFFPPGKVADYTGFQYLRDNDPDNMGHNTSFLTRVANNVIYILSDSQFNQLKALAVAQQDQINLYGYKRFALMKAFRRLLEGDIPSGSSGLNLNAVKQASR
jgi:hypothetical protein